MNIGVSQVPAQTGAAFPDSAGATRPDPTSQVLALVRAAGQRDAPVPAVSQALLAYWCALPRLDRTQRGVLVAQLRDAIKRGATTAHAWTCVALGDPDFRIVREATRGYLGTPAVSVERRGLSVAAVLDWIARELPLNRAAAFTALVDLNDVAVLEQLSGIRGRLSHTEAETVWTACAGTTSQAINEFIAEWRSAEPGC